MQVFWSPYTPEAVAALQKQQQDKEGGGASDSDDAATARQSAIAELQRLRSDPMYVLVHAHDMHTLQRLFGCIHTSCT